MKINFIYNHTKVFCVLFTLIVGLLSCQEDGPDVLFTGDNYENIMQYIEANPDYASFNKIVISAKMTDVLSSYNNNGGNNYSLFLPNNDAVARFIDESDRYSTFDALLLDTFYTKEIIRYHLVNGQIPSVDFPNGALNNKTISNYFLTVNFREENELITFYVNDESKVLLRDIELSNGNIHTIDLMLTPVVFTSFEWVEQRNDFTIFTELLSKCGLEDTLNRFELDDLGREIYDEYTLFAESDALYAENGIFSFNDLVKAIDPSGSSNQDFTSFSNKVNKYARYHVLESSYFLDEFGSTVYTTYGDLPISVDLDGILKINTKSGVFDTIISNGDTLLIDYLQINSDKSNIVSKNGAIHHLDQLLFPYLPGRKRVTIEFYEEPVINAIRSNIGRFPVNIEDLKFISLIGLNGFYFNKANNIARVANNDYIELDGDFDFIFRTRKILAGRYQLRLIISRGDRENASIQCFVDSKKVGVIVDGVAKIGNQPDGFNNDNADANVGIVDFSTFGTHTIKISTIIPGKLSIDRIILLPI